jgi:ankyrin repeat protein
VRLQQRGLVDCVRFLLLKGADVNAKTEDGRSALTVARKSGHRDIVAMLTAAGAT